MPGERNLRMLCEAKLGRMSMDFLPMICDAEAQCQTNHVTGNWWPQSRQRYPPRLFGRVPDSSSSLLLDPYPLPQISPSASCSSCSFCSFVLCRDRLCPCPCPQVRPKSRRNRHSRSSKSSSRFHPSPFCVARTCVHDSPSRERRHQTTLQINRLQWCQGSQPKDYSRCFCQSVVELKSFFE